MADLILFLHGDTQVFAGQYDVIESYDRVSLALNVRIVFFERNVEGKLNVIKFGLNIKFVSSENRILFTINCEFRGAIYVVDVSNLGKTDLLDLVYLIPNTIGNSGIGCSIASLALKINVDVRIRCKVSSLLAAYFP
jgi:hypothetical protein